MALSANKSTTPDPRPTGDLEQLFRQNFAEAEVTPRASLWDQIDHDLLVQQNEGYRRRLLRQRWLTAACVLLLLSLGGWATFRAARPGASAPEIAHQTQPLRSSGFPVGDHTTAVRQGASSARAVANTGAASVSASAVGPLVLRVEKQSFLQSFASQAFGREDKSSSVRKHPTNALASDRATVRGNGADLLASRIGAGVLGSAELARPDTLKPALLAAPMLAQQAVAAENKATQEPLPGKTGRWRVGGSYGVAAYNPNVDFGTTGSFSSAQVYPNTAFQQRATSDETKPRFRNGVAQRVALTARYALAKHWALVGGVELAEQRATASTQYAYLDGKSTPSTYDLLTNFRAQTTQTTHYRYRTAVVPVSLHYGSPKSGMSLYAKVGAAVGVLLSSRSTLEGDAGLTRTYTLSATDSPYRKVLASVRSGAGMRYRPADSTWSLALGPTAEAGLNTLNRNAANRSARPYSVGVEASIEFGGSKTALVAR